MTNVTIEKITPEASGDWHDKSLRWAVCGPGKEVQKFSTKANARLYAALRRREASQGKAIDKYVAAETYLKNLRT